GHAYIVEPIKPYFNCPDVHLPITTKAPTGPTVTTVSTVPAVPTTAPTPATSQPCMCAFTDAGATLGMNAPVSFCENRIKQTLQCDGKIFVKDGSNLVSYDSLSCTNGIWSGTSCDETPLELGTASVTVQCAAQEPPICPQIPSRDGLIYIGTEDGLQRYTCEGDELVRYKIYGDRTVHAKYIECN
ncbi:hypothetical protein PMAYCL1PPCAC_22273, partial [Pristionchus mayeri]